MDHNSMYFPGMYLTINKEIKTMSREFKQVTYVEMTFRTRDEARDWIRAVKIGLVSGGYTAEYTDVFKNLQSDHEDSAWVSNGSFEITLEEAPDQIAA